MKDNCMHLAVKQEVKHFGNGYRDDNAKNYRKKMQYMQAKQ